MLMVSVMMISTLPLNSLAQGSSDSNTGEQSMVALSDQYGTDAGTNTVPEELKVTNAEEQPAAPKSFAQELSNPNAREQLKAALSEQYGVETAAAMIESMISMGIIDENGNRLAYQIEMDGQLYSLDQMRDIVNAPGVDLATEVKVDDKAVTLAFIARLIDFEVYMKFVEDNFLNNKVKVSDEHLKSLADLESQLNTEGISLMAAPQSDALSETAYEPVPDALVTYSLGKAVGNTRSITYTLSGGGEHASVTFSQQCLAGVLGEVSDPAQTITLTTNAPTCTTTINLPDISSAVWSGTAVQYYLSLSDIRGGWFDPGDSSAPQSSILVTFANAKGTAAFIAYQPPLEMLLNTAAGWVVSNGSFANGTITSPYRASGTLTATQDIRLNADAAALTASGDLQISGSGYYAGIRSGSTVSLNVDFYAQDGVTSLGNKNASYTRGGAGAASSQTLSFSEFMVPAGTASMKLTVQHSSLINSMTSTISNLSITISDSSAPTVKSISAPAKTFKAGETVPVVVTFSEPVVQNNLELTLTMQDANGKLYTVNNDRFVNYNAQNIDSKASFTFQIPATTPINLWPVSVSAGVTDPSGNTSTVFTFPVNADPLASTFAYNELDSLTGLVIKHADGTALTGAYLPGEKKGRLEISLFQNSDPTTDGSTVGAKQNEWLISHTTVDAADASKFTVDRLYASIDNGQTKIPLYITNAADKLTAEFDLPSYSRAYKIRLYLAAEAPYTDTPIAKEGCSVNFSRGALTLVNADDMIINYPASYPSGSDKVLNLGDAETVKLTYTYSGNATYKTAADFKWVSSDDTIAVISAATGEITPIGAGKVTLILVATNGAGDGTRDTIKASEEFTVKGSLFKPSIAVSKFITTKKGESVQVMWSTNVIYINQQDAKDTVFTVELYEGNYASAADLAGKTPIYSTTINNANSCTIPGEQLTKLSSGPEPAYTVKISTDNPNASGAIVASVGNIIITSLPANVKIERPASYYILDTANPLTVNWASTNVNDTANGYDFEFAVTKNNASIGTSQSPSGSYPITFTDVTGKLKDVYTVTAKIKHG